MMETESVSEKLADLKNLTLLSAQKYVIVMFLCCFTERFFQETEFD
jgi:hypothetical protein